MKGNSTLLLYCRDLEKSYWFLFNREWRMLVVNVKTLFFALSKWPSYYSLCPVNRTDELNGYKVKLNTDDWTMSEHISFVTWNQTY